MDQTFKEPGKFDMDDEDLILNYEDFVSVSNQ